MNPVVIGDSTYIPITPKQAHTLYRDVQLWWKDDFEVVPQRCPWYMDTGESRMVADFKHVQNYLKVEDAIDGN